MNNFKLGKEAFLLSMMTFITVLTWVFFEVYQTAKKTTITQVTEKQMIIPNPKIKVEIINRLKPKVAFSPEELDSILTNLVVPVVSTESGTDL